MPSSVEQTGARPIGLGPERWARSDFALLATASVALAICCVLTSAKKFFWYDEVNSVNLVADPSLSHMIGTIAAGGESAPPLYHTLLWLWARVAGHGELALRVPSCTLMILGLILVWATLRRRYSPRSAAVGALVAFSLSLPVLHHVAEARFYGLLTALVALATYLYSRVVLEPQRMSRELVAATFATHAALVYTHVYGAIYSAAILVAWVVADRCAARWRPANYAAILAAWLTFVPWLPSLKHAADLARPRGWIATPTIAALFDVFGFAMHRLPIVVIALVVLSALGGLLAAPPAHVDPPAGDGTRIRRGAAAAGIATATLCIFWLTFRLVRSSDASTDLLRQTSGVLLLAIVLVVLAAVVVRDGGLRAAGKQEPLLLAAAAIVFVPFVAFALSIAVIPIFVDRYLLPSAVGFSIILAQGMELTTAAFDDPRRAAPPNHPLRPLRFAWACGLTSLAAYPVWMGHSANVGERPGSRLETVVPPHAVVIVPNLLDFMPILHYQRRSDIEYVFPMDREAYLDPRAPRSSIYGYNFMTVLEARGYLSPSPRNTASPLCSYSGLVIARGNNNGWPRLRIAADSGLAIEPLTRPAASADSTVALIVHERFAGQSRPCIPGVERPDRS